MLAFIVILCLVTGGLSILCPTKFDPQQTVHLPHPSNCSRFLTCVGDQPYEQDCPAGLHWNVQQSYCDYPQQSSCSRGELEPMPFNPTAVANSICLPQFDRCPVNSDPMENVIFLKHRDCRKFYACVSTQQVELSCPPNLYWNSESCQCNYEIDPECDGTDRVDEENAENEVPADEADESEDDVVPEAEPENVEDQEPIQEADESVDEVPAESDASVRVRRAADDEGSTTAAAATSTESATTVAETTSAAATTTSASSGSGTTGASGGGSSASTAGPGSGGSVESGADIRSVSSIVVIAFTAMMSFL